MHKRLQCHNRPAVRRSGIDHQARHFGHSHRVPIIVKRSQTIIKQKLQESDHKNNNVPRAIKGQKKLKLLEIRRCPWSQELSLGFKKHGTNLFTRCGRFSGLWCLLRRDFGREISHLQPHRLTTQTIKQAVRSRPCRYGQDPGHRTRKKIRLHSFRSKLPIRLGREAHIAGEAKQRRKLHRKNSSQTRQPGPSRQGVQVWDMHETQWVVYCSLDRVSWNDGQCADHHSQHPCVYGLPGVVWGMMMVLMIIYLFVVCSLLYMLSF